MAHNADFLVTLLRTVAVGVQAGVFGWVLSQSRWAMKRQEFWTAIAIYLAATGTEYVGRFIIWYITT